MVSIAPPAADDAYRSAYRVTDLEVVLLDQRRLPEAIEEVVARRGSDVAYYLRLGVARGGPVMAQVAAYGSALTAAERAAQGFEQRDLQLRRTERALIEARPSSRLLAWSMERMRGAVSALDESTPGDEVASTLRAEADAIADDFQTWNAAISGALAEELARQPGEPVTVLLHGDHGALHGGILGSGIAALTRLRDAGRAVHVYVTEARPFMDGARLASWELRGAGIEHKVLPDSAVAWLLEREPVDAVLINAEWVAANGDVSALVGARGIAQLAGAAGARVIVSGVSATVDPSTPDGAAIPSELLPARDLVAYLADVPVRAADALVPAADIIPAASISTLVTERGSVTPADAA